MEIITSGALILEEKLIWIGYAVELEGELDLLFDDVRLKTSLGDFLRASEAD